jgi:dTDP-4-amino-4,6-dideoxygalactose transaminase
LHEILIQNAIGVNLHYIPIYRQPFYENMGFKKGYCIESENFYETILSIPIYYGLTIEKQNRVIEIIKNAFK